LLLVVRDGAYRDRTGDLRLAKPRERVNGRNRVRTGSDGNPHGYWDGAPRSARTSGSATVRNRNEMALRWRQVVQTDNAARVEVRGPSHAPLERRTTAPARLDGRSGQGRDRLSSPSGPGQEHWWLLPPTRGDCAATSHPSPGRCSLGRSDHSHRSRLVTTARAGDEHRQRSAKDHGEGPEARTGSYGRVAPDEVSVVNDDPHRFRSRWLDANGRTGKRAIIGSQQQSGRRRSTERPVVWA
jgi:hypothetical protein